MMGSHLYYTCQCMLTYNQLEVDFFYHLSPWKKIQRIFKATRCSLTTHKMLLVLRSERRKRWNGLQYQFPPTTSSPWAWRVQMRRRDPLTIGRDSIDVIYRGVAKNLRHFFSSILCHCLQWLHFQFSCILTVKHPWAWRSNSKYRLWRRHHVL